MEKNQSNNLDGEDGCVEKSPRGRYIRWDVKLGSGAYKTVYKAYDTDQGIDVAWNAIDIGNLPGTEKARIIQEVQLLQQLEHKNIINFYGSWFSKEKNQVVFITEIMTAGTLKSYIKRVHYVKWKIIKRWCIQILEGLHYLHSQNPPVIHRDLKCDNIFINGNTGDIRIGDLGLSTQLARQDRSRAQSVLGTPEFMAPELYDESYDEKVDIYAFGMCVLEMVTKEVPYSECINAAQIYKKVIKGIRPKGLQRIVSQPAKDFIELCLSRGNGEIDVTAEYLISHPFLQSQEDDSVMVQVLDLDELETETQVVESTSEIPNDFVFKESSPKTTYQEKILPRKLYPISSNGSADADTISTSSESTAPFLNQSKSSVDTLIADEKSNGKRRIIKRYSSSNSSDGSMVKRSPLDPPPTPIEAPVIDDRGPLSEKKDERHHSNHHVEKFIQTLPKSEINMANHRIPQVNGRNSILAVQESKGNISEPDTNEKDESSKQVLPTSKQSSFKSDGSAFSPQQLPQIAEDKVKPLEPIDDREAKLKKNPSLNRRREFKAMKDPDKPHSIILTLRIMIEGKTKEIKFPFNLFTDSTHEVACELAVDVGIPELDLEDISDSIGFLVTEGKNNNLKEVHVDVWEEAPEPHSFVSKPLPHVSKLNFIDIQSAAILDSYSPNLISREEHPPIASMADLKKSNSHSMVLMHSNDANELHVNPAQLLSHSFSDTIGNFDMLRESKDFPDKANTNIEYHPQTTAKDLMIGNDGGIPPRRPRNTSFDTGLNLNYIRTKQQIESQIQKETMEHQRALKRFHLEMQALDEHARRAVLAQNSLNSINSYSSESTTDNNWIVTSPPLNGMQHDESNSSLMNLASDKHMSGDQHNSPLIRSRTPGMHDENGLTMLERNFGNSDFMVGNTRYNGSVLSSSPTYDRISPPPGLYVGGSDKHIQRNGPHSQPGTRISSDGFLNPR